MKQAYWRPGATACPACGAGRDHQTTVSRPDDAVPTASSLPSAVLRCDACGVRWEK